MASRRSFKSDESFLEKISIGAIGTRRVFENLKKQGHHPLELERGSMSFKIWKTVKIKRIRVPDILCVRCGRRVESRAKTKFEVSMSHSLSDPERGWDHGLHNDDLVAIVVCSKSGARPIDWTADSLVQYASVSYLRSAQKKGLVVITKPKGAQEGFEARILWPSAAASSEGEVISVSDERVQYRRANDKRTITLSISGNKRKLTPLVKVGQRVAQNQALASVVPIATGESCSQTISEDNYVDMLRSSSLGDRYTGAKALGTIGNSKANVALSEKLHDQREHIYVRIEAAAGLARGGKDEGYGFIENNLRDNYLQNRLEAVIVLGELNTDKSAKLLVSVLQNQSQHAEIRAGAAWALGELRNKEAMDALV